jgi:hypothetical protein
MNKSHDKEAATDSMWGAETLSKPVVPHCPVMIVTSRQDRRNGAECPELGSACRLLDQPVFHILGNVNEIR